VRLDVGDWLTLAGIVVSLVGTSAAIIISVKALNQSRRATAASERQAAAAEAMLPAPPPPVGWRFLWVQKQTYQLRNIGPKDATNVHVEHPSWVVWRVRESFSGFPQGVTIPAGTAVTYAFLKTYGSDDLDATTMWVTCDQVERTPIPLS
jgi:hypothetical protein